MEKITQKISNRSSNTEYEKAFKNVKAAGTGSSSDYHTSFISKVDLYMSIKYIHEHLDDIATGSIDGGTF